MEERNLHANVPSANMWAAAEYRAIATEYLVECGAIPDAKKCAQAVKEAQTQAANILAAFPDDEIRTAVAKANTELEKANNAVENAK